VAIHHHSGVFNGKIRELYGAYTGAADFEHWHINIGPEVYLMDGKAFLSRRRAGAPGQLRGGTGHPEVTQGIVAPAVVDLQPFDANGGKVEY
jgi:hypothetical protein